MIVVYLIVTVLTILSYIFTRDFLVDTNIGYISVSNVTLNFVLLFMVVGGIAPWVARTYFPKAKVGLPLTISFGLTLLFLMSVLGYTIKPTLTMPLSVIMVLSYVYVVIQIVRSRRNARISKKT